ncbi:hypothetical protein GOP47_0030949 [Adiantum capillus-veneris]|nr:hypothetical protein GOP47_0030949 [Adiantum capillus-veneris]
MKELTKGRRFDLVERWFNRMAKGTEDEDSTTNVNYLMLAYYKEKVYDEVMNITADLVIFYAAFESWAKRPEISGVSKTLVKLHALK